MPADLINKKILVVSRSSAICDSGKVFFQRLDGQYLDGIAKGFNQMTIVAPIHRKGLDETFQYKKLSYTFKSSNIRLIEIPEYKSYEHNLIDRFSRLPGQFTSIFQQINQHEYIFVMMPTFRAAFGAVIGSLYNKKIILYSGNDWLNDLQSSPFEGNFQDKIVFNLYQILCDLAEKSAVRASNICLFNGKSLLEKYKKHSGIIAQTHFLLNIKKRDIYCRKDSCSKEKIRIICVANINPRKGINYLINALLALNETNNKFSLELVGAVDHPYGNEMIHLSEELGLSEFITFHGYISTKHELLKLYRQSDIFILPSLSEGFPRVIFEAMSQSLPVISTSIPNISNYLNSNLAYFVSTKNSQSIVRAVNTISENKKLRQSLILNGFNYINELIDTNNPHKQFLDLVRKL